MENQIVKIDPKEFGLETTQVETIEQAFAPKIAERDGLAVIYQQVISKELTNETCQEAGNLRKKLVKVRTGIADIHKSQKAFFLAAGRFVDAWKNKETLPIEQMEENLEKIEKHFILIEQERVAKLETERRNLLLQFGEFVPASLGLMESGVFEAYYNSQKQAYELRIQAEKQAEIDRLAAIEAERLENERIRKENERLQAEADAKEKQLADERKAAEAARLKAQAEADAKQKAIEDAARIEREKQAAIIAKQAAELKAKTDADARAKAEAARIEQERIAAANKAAKAPDKDKLKAFINSIVLPELPEMKQAESLAVLNVVTQKFEAFKTWAVSQIESI